MSGPREITPKRRAELKRMRLYLWLGVIAMLIGFACMWGAGRAIQATLPEPITLAIVLLWGASLFGWLAGYTFWHRRAMLRSQHQTKDAIDLGHHIMDELDKALDLVEQNNQISDRLKQASQVYVTAWKETYNTLRAIIEDDRDALDQIMPPKRGDWQPQDQTEIDRVLAQAEKEAAKIEAATGHKATEREIAKAIGMSDRHLRRYRKADTSGHK